MRQQGLISIHKALTSLDILCPPRLECIRYFNPQGSHEPRPYKTPTTHVSGLFQSTRLSRASTAFLLNFTNWYFLFQSTRLSRASTNAICGVLGNMEISIHKALTSLDTVGDNAHTVSLISIHKALTSLDRIGQESRRNAKTFQSTRLSRAST